jgi:CBS domain-containing protein
MAVNQESQVFLFLSQILGKKIVDTAGRPLGVLADLVVNPAESYPLVTDILVSSRRKVPPVLIPWERVADCNGRFTVRPEAVGALPARALADNELLLRDALLDKQIVDTDGAKVRRVNDLQFLKAHRCLYLIHVDVGFRGLMRRVGLEKVMDAFLRWFFDYTLSDQWISWKFVQPLSTPDLLRLSITQHRLSQLHPADLADIIEDLDIHKRTAVFRSLDVETAAETLEETDPKIQVRLIEDMKPEKSADIIEEMSLSEAADLLGDLPKEKADGILKEMEQDVAEDVKELLTHPEETAGGLMTSAFLKFRPEITAGEALDYLRREAEEMDTIHYLYVTDAEDRLLGVISLREILIADPAAALKDLMDERVVAVRLDEEPDEIAEQFAKYGVTAIPVVDADDRIEGVILFKNLLEVVAPHLGK